MVLEVIFHKMRSFFLPKDLHPLSTDFSMLTYLILLSMVIYYLISKGKSWISKVRTSFQFDWTGGCCPIETNGYYLLVLAH